MLALAATAAAALYGDAAPLKQACEPIRVMTYNILVSADLESEGRFRWPLRRDEIIGQIQAMQPAILGLQEVSRVQKADLRRVLSSYKFEGIAGETSVLAAENEGPPFRVTERLASLAAPC